MLSTGQSVQVAAARRSEKAALSGWPMAWAPIAPVRLVSGSPSAFVAGTLNFAPLRSRRPS
jgi:hypothetical protein